MKQEILKLTLSLSLSIQLLSFNLMAAVPLKEKVEVNKSITIHHYEMPNGFQIFLTPNKNAPNVTVSHWVKAGSLHERKGITGIAHLFEHMMFRPLETGKPSFFEIVSKLGGQLNANTRFESTYYYSTVPSDKIEELLLAEADRFKKLKVSDELLNIERKAVWSEYSTKFDSNPEIESWFNIYNIGFPGHPFEWTIIGYREDLEKIKASDCNEFFAKFYRPNNVGIFVTGNFEINKVLNAIEKYYGDWQKGEEVKIPDNFNAPTKFSVTEGKLDSEAKMVLAGFRVPMFNAKNIEVMTLANFILFGGSNSLLKKILVNQKKIASEVSEYNFHYDNGMVKANIITLPGVKLSDVKEGILSLEEKFDQLSDEQFSAYKMNLYIDFTEGIEKNYELASLSSLIWGKYEDIHLLKKFTSKPLSISKSEIKDFIKKYLREDNLVLAISKGMPK